MLQQHASKPVRRVVGLMSGTSVDGIDAALIELRGSRDYPEVTLLAFQNTPYPPNVRAQIFDLFQPTHATVDKVGYLNVLLGELYAAAALEVIAKAGLTPAEVDAIGSHGQTIWHQPETQAPDGIPVHFTVQIGEGAVIARRTGLPCVSDFRVADMAAGGQGAPLVPFSEYLLYRRAQETILLQNIGGIGNVSVLPAGCGPEAVFAFDTGPGNMIIDGVVSALYPGEKTMDVGGSLAAAGRVDAALLAQLKQDDYYRLPLPKSTGRERFGTQYTAQLLGWQRTHSLSNEDLVATVTALTAWSIADAYEHYILPHHRADLLVVGGGGSYNPTLLRDLSEALQPFGVQVRVQEDLGYSSDAKEAVAFALLADWALAGLPNNLPSVTGAKAPAVMGKISLP